MSLLGEIISAYYSWLILGWVIGTALVVGGAGTALLGRYLWNELTDARLELASTVAERTRVEGAGHRYEVVVENTGRQDAVGCRATLRLAGTDSRSGDLVRASRPLGWLDPAAHEGSIPDGLPRTETIPSGETRRLHLGHTTTVHYQFVFPDVVTARGMLVRPGPDPPDARGGDDRRLPFRCLNRTDWDVALLEVEPADGEPVSYRVAFDAELANADPTIRFGNAAFGEDATRRSASPARPDPGAGGGDERERAT